MQFSVATLRSLANFSIKLDQFYDFLQFTRMIDQYRKVRVSDFYVLAKHSQRSFSIINICGVSTNLELTYETELLVAFYCR